VMRPWQVCDQPHPLLVTSMVKCCLEGKVDYACATMRRLFGARLRRLRHHLDAVPDNQELRYAGVPEAGIHSGTPGTVEKISGESFTGNIIGILLMGTS